MKYIPTALRLIVHKNSNWSESPTGLRNDTAISSLPFSRGILYLVF